MEKKVLSVEGNIYSIKKMRICVVLNSDGRASRDIGRFNEQ